MCSREIEKLERGRSYELVKQIIDLFIASVGLVFCAPLFVVIILLIKMESPGPAFFLQRRVGRGGRVFTLLKFRSMSVDAEEVFHAIAHLNQEPTGLIIKIPNDPRVTRVGRFLRKSSLDELPQFINVLRGEMSIIGPRPPSPKEVDQYNGRQRRRLEVLPGMTGLWQVSGRKDTNFDYMVEKDIEYIEGQGLWMDLKVLLKTIPCLFLGKGAR